RPPQPPPSQPSRPPDAADRRRHRDDVAGLNLGSWSKTWPAGLDLRTPDGPPLAPPSTRVDTQARRFASPDRNPMPCARHQVARALIIGSAERSRRETPNGGSTDDGQMNRPEGVVMRKSIARIALAVTLTLGLAPHAFAADDSAD